MQLNCEFQDRSFTQNNAYLWDEMTHRAHRGLLAAANAFSPFYLSTARLQDWAGDAQELSRLQVEWTP